MNDQVNEDISDRITLPLPPKTPSRHSLCRGWTTNWGRWMMIGPGYKRTSTFYVVLKQHLDFVVPVQTLSKSMRRRFERWNPKMLSDDVTAGTSTRTAACGAACVWRRVGCWLRYEPWSPRSREYYLKGQRLISGWRGEWSCSCPGNTPVLEKVPSEGS